MGTLPDFELPSRPGAVVRLREATVSDALDFSDIDPAFEEAATTQFLDRMQEKDVYSDPRAWTGEDRRYALFIYHVHTTKFHDIPLSYECTSCGSPDKPVRHHIGVPLAAMAEQVQFIQGEAKRDVVYEGHAVVVHPLLGEDLEDLEKLRFDILAEEAASKRPARKARARLKLMELLRCIDIPARTGGGNRRDRLAEMEKFVLALPETGLRELSSKVYAALTDMRHGLDSTYQDGQILLKTPPVKCPEGKENDGPGTALTFPFRAFDYLPYI